MPETRTGRRIRVEAGDREALGLSRETGPAQRRGDVPPGHAEPVKDLVVRHHLAIGDVIAAQVERRNGRQEVVRERRTVSHGLITSSSGRTGFPRLGWSHAIGKPGGRPARLVLPGWYCRAGTAGSALPGWHC